MSAEDTTECGICFDDFNDLTNGARVDAHYGSDDCQEKSKGKPHFFHTKCIQTWVSPHEGTARCPICRCDVNNQYIQGLNPTFNLFKWLHVKPAVRYMVDFVNNVHYLSGLILVLGMLSLPFYSTPEGKPELIKDIERLYKAVPELKDVLVEIATIILRNDMRLDKALDMMWGRIEDLEKDLLKRIRKNRDIPNKYIEIMKKPPTGIRRKYNREYQQNIESEKVVSSFLKGKEDTNRFLDELIDAVTSEHMDHLAESDKGTVKVRMFDKIIKNFDKENAEHFAILLLGRLATEGPVWEESTAPNSLAGVEHPLNSADIYPLGVQGLENFHSEGRKPSLLGSESPPPRVIKSPLAFLGLAGLAGHERLASKGGSKRVKRRRRATHRRK